MACWEDSIAVRPGCPKPLWRTCQVRRKARRDSRSATDTKSEPGSERKKEFLKMNDRRGNVYENKGPLWKTGSQSGNLIENKGAYELKAGMLLKRKEVGCRPHVVGGRRTQVSGFRSREVEGGAVSTRHRCSTPLNYLREPPHISRKRVRSRLAPYGRPIPSGVHQAGGQFRIENCSSPQSLAPFFQWAVRAVGLES
jgi:hypothetical protein